MSRASSTDVVCNLWYQGCTSAVGIGVRSEEELWRSSRSTDPRLQASRRPSWFRPNRGVNIGVDLRLRTTPGLRAASVIYGKAARTNNHALRSSMTPAKAPTTVPTTRFDSRRFDLRLFRRNTYYSPHAATTVGEFVHEMITLPANGDEFNPRSPGG